MKLKKYLKTVSSKAFAAEVGTSLAYLYQLSGGFRTPSYTMAMAIDRASGGKVSKSELRPDIWPIENKT